MGQQQIKHPTAAQISAAPIGTVAAACEDAFAFAKMGAGPRPWLNLSTASRRVSDAVVVAALANHDDAALRAS